jgi:hypothetical protein
MAPECGAISTHGPLRMLPKRLTAFPNGVAASAWRPRGSEPPATEQWRGFVCREFHHHAGSIGRPGHARANGADDAMIEMAATDGMHRRITT